MRKLISPPRSLFTPFGFARSGGSVWSPLLIPSAQLWLPGDASTFADGGAGFDGTNWLSVASNASLQTGDVDFWYSMWLQRADNDNRYALVKGLDFGGPVLEVVVSYVAGSYRFRVANDTTLAAIDVAAPSVGAWAHVLVWHDSINNTINIRLNNGTPVSLSWAGGVQTNDFEFGLGGSGAMTGWNGGIDSVMFGKNPPGGIASIISNIASSLYNSGAGKTYADLTASEKSAWGLVSAFDFPHSGAIGVDSHGGNDLTNNGVTSVAGIAAGAAQAGEGIASRVDLVNGYVASQEIFAARAEYDGAYWASFDGSDDSLSLTIPAIPPPYTVFLTATARASSGGRRAVHWGSNNLLGPYSDSWRLHSAGFVNGPSVIFDEPVVLIGIVTATGKRLRVNGVEYTSGIGGSNLDGNVVIGSQGGGEWHDGLVGDLGIVADEISASDIARLESYIAARAGVTL
jgi:hypothetical protein